MGKKIVTKEMLKQMIESEDWRGGLIDTNLFRRIKTHLQNNESSLIIKNCHYPSHYYTTLCLVTLNAKNNSFNLLPILKSIEPSDKEIFTFFVEEILGKIRPSSIKHSPLKTLIEAILNNYQEA